MGIPGKLAAAGIAGILVGLGASFAAPRSYASQTVISVEGPPTPDARADLIHSLAERAWTRGALASMIDNFDLYAGASAGKSLQALTTEMRQQISTTPAGADNTRFQIRFEYGEPHAAQKVVADLSRRLMAENDRTEQLGIPGANLKVASPPTLPNSPLFSVHWILLLEGLAGGLVAGALLSFRKARAA
jgi:hypothetical protein